MITAKEAFASAHHRLVNAIPDELRGVLSKIEMVSSIGRLETEVDSLFDENLKQLLELGFKVEPKGEQLQISWSRPE